MKRRAEVQLVPAVQKFTKVSAPASQQRTYMVVEPAPQKRANQGRVGYEPVPRTKGVYGAGEMKYFDTDYIAAVAAQSNWTGTEADPATYLTLCVPVVGAAINQRIGREIKVWKIKIRGQITCIKAANQTAGRNGGAVRVVLVQDMQTNSAQMQGEDVFATDTNTPVNSFQNLNNFGRFRVLKDKMFIFQDPNLSYDGTNIEANGLIKTFKMNVTFKQPVEIRFNSTNGGTIADIATNSFHVLANCNNVDLVPTLSYSARVCYKE